jgi:hypothetical protein
MKPLTSVRNLTPTSTEFVSVPPALDGLALLEKMLHGHAPGTDLDSISYPSSGPISGNFSFAALRRLVSVDAYNGGSGPSTITLTCGSNPTVTQTLAPGQLSTISTNWSTACTFVTVGSSDGWWTNFDNVTYTN